MSIPASRTAISPIADQFVLESQVGAGGMGAVYRARDTHTGRTVAIKLLQSSGQAHDTERFAREAALLSQLRHPGIVTYLAHGETVTGQAYLAMEWLEGEDLAKRLSRGPLPLPEALVLLRRIAEALAVAHACGVVHRDLKPSNLFLRDGQVERVAVLDFGIARRAEISEVLTGTGVIIGTPSYMAPEQARGDRQLTAAADIFSLGCVLFECLTGQCPFAADRPIAVLARILFAETPLLRRLRPEMPEAVEALLGRMLAKEANARVADAAALLAALDTLGEVHFSAAPAALSRGGERQLLSVLMAVPSADARAPSAQQAAIDTEQLVELRRELADQGARLEVLADGSLVATLRHTRGAATDQAARAAQCALLIKSHWPRATIALGTGSGLADAQAPTGEVFDRTAMLLRDHTGTHASEQILLDDVTRGLIEVRFVVRQTPTGAYALTGEELTLDASRPLLGKPTPCVGRELELNMLESILAGCIEDGEPYAVLVTAPPGAGKSRLRHELLRRIEARGEKVSILIGRGDPISAGSSHSLLGQALRRLCGIVDGESLQARHHNFATRIGQRISAEERLRIIAFVGELCSVGFPDADDAMLRAARQDPQLMHHQITRAVLDFLCAECAEHPVLLVLEDLHWGDALTVKLIDDALRKLRTSALMVLALARPEVHEQFPRLWPDATQVLTLRPLNRKAGARLVQQVLGTQVSEQTVARIVEQSEGNALLLEELIRAVAEGRGDEAPETVLALLQARIGRLEAGARRVLRVASVFGEICWQGGIGALLGGSISDRELQGWLALLLKEEILAERRESRFAGEQEYRFHHALMRDAAYGLLHEADRPPLHRLAGAYLEEIGETNPLVLAEHYHLGQALDHALRCYVRAAKDLFDRHNLPAALRCIEAGKACGASGAELTLLCALQASSAFWMGDLQQACTLGGPTLLQLPAGSYQWCRLMSGLIPASAQLGRQEALLELSRMLLGATPEPDARSAYVEAGVFLVNNLSWLGFREQAGVFLEKMDAVGASANDVVVRGWISTAHSWYDHYFGWGQWQMWCSAEEGGKAFREAGDQRNRVAPGTMAGVALAALGDQTGAEETLREILAIAEQVGQPFPISYAKIYLALVLAGSDQVPRRDEARDLALWWVSSNSPNILQLGMAHDVIARVAARGGDPEQAEAHARKACELLTPFPPFRLLALTTLSEALLQRGRAEDAKDAATLGAQLLSDVGGAGELPVRLALVEALHAAGDAGAARAALEKAIERLRLAAGDIPDAAARKCFLTNVPANARLCALAREWLQVELGARVSS